MIQISILRIQNYIEQVDKTRDSRSACYIRSDFGRSKGGSRKLGEPPAYGPDISIRAKNERVERKHHCTVQGSYTSRDDVCMLGVKKCTYVAWMTVLKNSTWHSFYVILPDWPESCGGGGAPPHAAE